MIGMVIIAVVLSLLIGSKLVSVMGREEKRFCQKE